MLLKLCVITRIDEKLEDHGSIVARLLYVPGHVQTYKLQCKIRTPIFVSHVVGGACHPFPSLRPQRPIPTQGFN